MDIDIKVFPRAKRNTIKQESDMFEKDIFKIYVTAPAVDGKANQAVRRALADYFQVSPSSIEIIKGLKSRHKTVRIKSIL